MERLLLASSVVSHNTARATILAHFRHTNLHSYQYITHAKHYWGLGKWGNALEVSGSSIVVFVICMVSACSGDYAKFRWASEGIVMGLPYFGSSKFRLQQWAAVFLGCYRDWFPGLACKHGMAVGLGQVDSEPFTSSCACLGRLLLLCFTDDLTLCRAYGCFGMMPFVCLPGVDVAFHSWVQQSSTALGCRVL